MVEVGWREELDGWLEPFLAVIGHEKRRPWAPVYLRGCLGPATARARSRWAEGPRSAAPLRSQHGLGTTRPCAGSWLREPIGSSGGPDAVLVLEDTALSRQGRYSVGVARQYCCCLGKCANCQALVSLTLAGAEVPVPIGLRLFLPQTWAADAGRCVRADVPEANRRALAKRDIALASCPCCGAERGTPGPSAVPSSASRRILAGRRSAPWSS